MKRNKASIIVIGSELTKGIIQDSHTAFIAGELTKCSYDVSTSIIIPDDGSIEKYLTLLIKNNDLLIITGGLGPTTDDMTRLSIANAVGQSLVVDENSSKRLKERLKERYYGANEKQCYRPESFSMIENINGTADGFYGLCAGCLIYALPGPPRELRPMFIDIIKSLTKSSEKIEIEASTFLISEAKLEELSQSIKMNVEWGTRFQDSLITLYIKGDEAHLALKEMQKICSKELIMEGKTTALDLLVEKLLNYKLTISCAESCTGGLASSFLTQLAGSSEFFKGAFITYSNEVKKNILNVSEKTLSKEGAVSLETAIAMAESTCKLLDTDIAFSITGVAGPGESEKKKVGTVCFAFASKTRKTQCVKLHFNSYSREGIRKKAVVAAFLLTINYIESNCLLDIVKNWNYI